MVGKRKYNRGRLLGADIAIENVDVDELTDEEEPDFNNRNYGKKLTGLWVFGICTIILTWYIKQLFKCCLYNKT